MIRKNEIKDDEGGREEWERGIYYDKGRKTREENENGKVKKWGRKTKRNDVGRGECEGGRYFGRSEEIVRMRMEKVIEGEWKKWKDEGRGGWAREFIFMEWGNIVERGRWRARRIRMGKV
jgi:hypothetical protein